MSVENILYIDETTAFVHKEPALESTVLRTGLENNNLSVLSSSRNLLYLYNIYII